MHPLHALAHPVVRRAPLTVLLPTSLAGALAAQEPTPPEKTTPEQPSFEQLLERLDAQEKRIQSLEGTHATYGAESNAVAGYDKGFFIRATDSPFALRINGRMQFRMTTFDADRGGQTVAEPTYRSDFEIERGRLEFRGTFLDTDTHFYVNLDADTDDSHAVLFHDFWVNHKFSESFDLYVGKAFVPGSRDWLEGSTRTTLIDRSMATTFFRPDRTIGIWALGQPIEDVHYRVMIGNGVMTSDLRPGQIDNRFAYSASLWWDPLADYGSGYADLEWHQDLAARVGASATYEDVEDGSAPTNGEADAIRLSDGQALTALDADSFDYELFAIDAAIKYQGLSVHGEAFFRELDEIVSPTVSSLRRSYYDWGGYCDVGQMILAKKLELVARVSTVQGALDDSWEYAAGFNWFINGTHLNKLSVDASKLDGSPTNNGGTNHRLGDDGWMIRIQWQTGF